MRTKNEVLLPRDIGTESGEASTFLIIGVFTRRMPNGKVLRSINLSGHYFLPLHGEEARPLLDIWGADMANWLERRLRIRLNRDPHPTDCGEPDCLSNAYQLEPIEGGTS